MLFKRSGANLWALKILKDADRASFTRGRTAEALDVVGVVFVRSMGEVEAGDVHAKTQQFTHGGFVVAGRADGANDLGAAQGGIVYTFGSRCLCQFQLVSHSNRSIGRLQHSLQIVRDSCESGHRVFTNPLLNRASYQVLFVKRFRGGNLHRSTFLSTAQFTVLATPCRASLDWTAGAGCPHKFIHSLRLAVDGGEFFTQHGSRE